ncbi:conjugative transposon protein TraN [Myroides odoratimimus]|uniref:Conjugative transposon TraN protein n=1 Tax=Myroides odoratimimus CCUG 10230 TaxID=883150 RepID=A0ABP2NEJ6_9FLAO|nr:conjugative transposon protein TraN [Myroides odoratimimus]EHO11867.1 conjugative transposon TraN protein [Myroides odoratimimus CCUG 10230]MCS7474607.1 conjugative transposon protein TraN [Myroides odoratimimus]MDM1467800.1 conjugative transposon protein TraN [Myroides odoratimimus]MDM1471046.1 conjugative transposon protein TraN [Myroides odoratimimus]MDM1481108.1 conjugative transposon protein TraN [Myroides odoratimimus]
MKTIIKYMLLCVLTVNTITAQNKNQSIDLSTAEVTPYEIELTQNKTTHILFPSSIEYVDLGSSEIIASKVETSSNVLRLKTIKEDISPTNFTVITNDGKYYSFNATYNEQPTQLSYDLNKFEKQNSKKQSEVLFKDLGTTSPSLANLLMKAIIKKNKKELNIKSKNYSVEARLKSIYSQDGKLYFHIFINNKSNLPYIVDYISFKIKDRRTVKRTTIQEVSLKPVRSYDDVLIINSRSKQDNVFILDQFTLSDKQMLIIEINEKRGIRNQVLKVKSSDVLKVKRIDYLKF